MSIYQKASLVQIPSGYKAADAKLYSVVPNSGDGDFTVSSDADATRVNKDGLVETTVADQARLNYNFIDGVVQPDPHLLLEPTRTNLITQSETYTTVSKANLTVSDNTSITDPQGGTDTKTLTATSASQPRLEWRGTSVPASNTSYAMSFWVRYNTARYVAIAHFSQTGEYAIFDLVDGEVESDVGTQTAKIEAYPNGWYKVSKSFEVPSSASLNYWKFTLCTQTNAFVGVNGEKADVFGLQLEAGIYPTSLIPTSGLSVTRTKDRCTGGGDSNLFNDNEGVLFVDAEALSDADVNRYITLSDGTATNAILIQYRNNGELRLYNGGIGSSNLIFSDSGADLTDRKKIAIQYGTTANDYKVYIDGVSKTISGSFTATAMSGLDRFRFDYVIDTLEFFGKVYQAMVFNEALTDAELITLTS
ncbi:MAG: phage head spike fiber domain-containing protein [Planctomycetota bacterium]|jgi:hypothetical protein